MRRLQRQQQPQQQQPQQQQQKRGYFSNFGNQLQQFQPSFNISLPMGPFNRQQKQEKLPDISSAFGSTMKEVSDMGVGIATKYPTGSLKFFQRTARQMKSQPFNLTGRGTKTALKPAERFMQRAQQISNQPFAMSGGQGKQKGSALFTQKANQISNQPFKLLIQPPSPAKTPMEMFASKAKQMSRQPFALGGKGPPPEVSKKQDMALFKKKAKSIGFLASTTLFHKVMEEEIEKHGRFKSCARAVQKTQRMFRGLKEYDPTKGSNEVEIKKGIYPMLRRDVLEILFPYMSVPDLKTARLVCDFWKRFATIVIQQKTVVRLSGICPLCRSDYMSDDPEIPEHDHSETISFYRFIHYIQDYPQEKHYHLPFRTFKISKLNLYFIPGLNTAPTRAFLMFLKLWGDKVHELRLKSVHMSPPDALYRILDTCTRMRTVTFDDVRVWQDPLASVDKDPPMFKMKMNHYVTSITFCTNWIGEELLHWQMILEAYPCLEEINMVDVGKPEINHLLTAMLNLPEEEEIEEVRNAGGFKKMSRKLMFMKIGGSSTPTGDERTRVPSPKLILNMPFSIHRVYRLMQVDEEDDESKFKKMAKNVSIRGVLTIENIVPAAVTPASWKGKTKHMLMASRMSSPLPDTPARPELEAITTGIKFKKFAKKIGGMPFKLSSLTPEAEAEIKGEGAPAFKKLAGRIGKQPFKLSSLTPEAEAEIKGEGATAFKKLAGRAGKQPFKLSGGRAGDAAPDGSAEGATPTPEGAEGATVSTEVQDGDQATEKPKTSGRFRKKAKSYTNQPFRMVPPTIPEEKKPEKKLKKKIRGIINQPFTILSPTPEQAPAVFVPKTFKSQIKKILHNPFQVKKPSALLKFKAVAKNVAFQPFNLGAPKPQEKVLAGSRLKKINIATRRNFEDQLKIDLALDDDTGDELNSGDEGGYHSRSDSEESDDSSSDSIKSKDLNVFDTHELLAEVVVRFDITHLTLRVHYTTEDAANFPIVLEACREKVRYLTLTRPTKVYFSELDLQFRQNPFETPEETIIEFPYVRSLSIAHNFVDSIDEIRASFPSLRKLTVNIVPTEFLVPKKKPYMSYVKTNLMITMRGGRTMPNVKVLEWNITEARHPYTLKRTLVYKSNALRYAPRIFPNLSKLVVSITTAHELHVIFRSCTQLHDLVVLKNSFYRTKDSDIIGDLEKPEEEYDTEEDEAAREARLARAVHPTRLKNGGIKQLIYLRRLALQNNNCCLTNRSIEEGFIHLRRLRSLHISLAKRISVRAIRLLKKCRFLVHVRITKDKLKTPQPPPPPEPDDQPQDGQDQQQLPQPLPPGYPPFCIPSHQVPTHPKLGFESGTKFDKIGGKRYAIVKTTYEVNGRTYELIRKQYECKDDRDSQIWESRFRAAERRRQLEEEKNKVNDKWKEAEIDGMEIVRKAEKRIMKEQIDQESDYERFMIDYDEDEDEDEEGYCDDDDDQLLEEMQIPQMEESSDEDGICLEADTMYEGDKENYIDTEPKSSTGEESYCDSPSDPEYQADKDTGDEKTAEEKEGNKDDKSLQEQSENPTEAEAQQTTPTENTKPETADETKEVTEEPTEAESPQPPTQTASPQQPSEQSASPQPTEERPVSVPSHRANLLEMLKLKTEKSKAKRKQKKEKAKKKKSSKIHPVAEKEQPKRRMSESTTSSTCTSGPFRHSHPAHAYPTSSTESSVPIVNSRRPSTSSLSSPYVPSASTRSTSSAISAVQLPHRRRSSVSDPYSLTDDPYGHLRDATSASSTSNVRPYAPSFTKKSTSSSAEPLTNEKVGIEYREAMRRMSMTSSLSSHGPSHVSNGHGRHGLHHFDAQPDSNNSTDGEHQHRASRDKSKSTKDKKEKPSKRSKSGSKSRKKDKKDKKKRCKSAEGKERKNKSPSVNEDALRRAGSVSPSQMQLLGDLRQQLIQKMVKDVRMELKKH